jgi:hypothetical protein
MVNDWGDPSTASISRKPCLSFNSHSFVRSDSLTSDELSAEGS